MLKNSLFISSLLIILVACSPSTNNNNTANNTSYDLALNKHLYLFEALPTKADNPNNISTPEKIELGHILYFDTRLSLTGNNSCNSCHNLATFGVDNLPTSEGDNGGFGDRNSPTVLNAALHSMQFWDGRAKDVEEQAGAPITNPVEMAIPSKAFLVERLNNIELYKEWFAKAYPNEENPITYENVQNSIACFERELLTPSRFDKYLNGDENALTEQEKKGMLSFVLNGCTTCHSGVLLGGNTFQKFGVYEDFWKAINDEKRDKGLASVTNNTADEFMFKVPSLRNVEHTYPYFHNGSVDSLEQAVRIMAELQLNKELSDTEVKNITAFLKSLSGDIPQQYKTEPKELKTQL